MLNWKSGTDALLQCIYQALVGQQKSHWLENTWSKDDPDVKVGTAVLSLLRPTEISFGKQNPCIH